MGQFKHINYIADYEAGTPFIDITTIFDISHRQYSGISGVIYIFISTISQDLAPAL